MIFIEQEQFIINKQLNLLKYRKIKVQSYKECKYIMKAISKGQKMMHASFIKKYLNMLKDIKKVLSI